MRAVGYFTSTVPANGPGSPRPRSPAPDEEVREFCRVQGHQLVALFTPGSGESEQAAYDRMAAAFRGPTARPALVLVPDSTHLAPNLELLAHRLLELRSLGCDVRCTDPQTPDIVMNAVERLGLRGPANQRDKRVRSSVLAKASRGETLGRTPYGYKAGIDGGLHQVPQEAQVVKDIFRWYTGQVDSVVVTSAQAVGEAVKRPEPIGLRQIARRLTDAGLRTRQGRPWTPVALANILRNRAYLGHYSRYGVWIVGAHKPLIDRSAFTLAQSIIAGRKPVRQKRHAEPFALSGLLTCGACGESVFGITRKRTWKRQDGTSRTEAYRYYACRARPPRCTIAAAEHANWRAEALESAVTEALGGDRQPGHVNLNTDQTRANRAVVNAEREFMGTFRGVASGKARTETLQPALAALRTARSAAAGFTGVGKSPSTGGAGPTGFTPARKLILHKDRVEIAPAA